MLLPATGMALSDAAYTELQFMLEAVGGAAGAGVHNALASAFAAAAAAAGGGGGAAGPLAGRSLSLASRQGGGVRLANIGALPPASPGFSTEEPLTSGTGNGSSAAAAAAAAAALGGRGEGVGVLSGNILPGGSGTAHALGLGLDGGGTCDLSPQASVLPASLALRSGADGGGGQQQLAAVGAAGGGGAGGGAWSTLNVATPAVTSRGGNAASESSPRVPRSRLSNTSAQPPPLTGLAANAMGAAGGGHTGGPASPTITTGGNAIGGNANLMLSTNNSLMGALIGTSSVGGRSNGANAIAGGGDAAIAAAAAATGSGADGTMSPVSGSIGVSGTGRTSALQQSMMQMTMSLPSHVPPLGSPGLGGAGVVGGGGGGGGGGGTLQVQSSCLSGAMAGRHSGRMNRACRRQMSDLVRPWELNCLFCNRCARVAKELAPVHTVCTLRPQAVLASDCLPAPGPARAPASAPCVCSCACRCPAPSLSLSALDPSALRPPPLTCCSCPFPLLPLPPQLATMPCDVSDTLTVMRTNMDILVSSFWNTLRAQHNEATPRWGRGPLHAGVAGRRGGGGRPMQQILAAPDSDTY